MPTPTTPFQLTDQFNMANFNEKIADTNTYIQEMVAAAQAAGTKIQTGSYVGTGTYGQDNPCSLTFNFEPKLLIVGAVSSEHLGVLFGLRPGGQYWSHSFIWTNLQQNTIINDERNYISVTGNTVSWYLISTYEKDGSYQCNDSNTTYTYIAIG